MVHSVGLVASSPAEMQPLREKGLCRVQGVTRRQVPLSVLSFPCPQLRVSGYVQSSQALHLTPCPAACL